MEDAQPTARSPDVSPVQLRDCIEELLRSVLEWSINGTLGVDIGVSPDFCSALLDHGENDVPSSGIPASSSTGNEIFVCEFRFSDISLFASLILGIRRDLK